jgi:nicotinamidase-related amidase
LSLRSRTRQGINKDGGKVKDSSCLLKGPQACCLVLIDVQEKLAAVMHDREGLIRNCAILIQIAHALEIPVLWCEQAPRALGPTVSDLKNLLNGNQPIEKTSFSGGGEVVFNKRLEEIGRPVVILCGIESHVCVFQTAADLIGRGLKVHVIADAVSSRTVENKEIGLARMSAAGAVISSTEMLLFELLKDARHEKFRQLAALIK